MFNRFQVLPSFMVLISLLVAACNGENTDQVSSQKDVQAPIAEDNFSQVVLSENKSIVSLKSDVQDPQGLPVKLINVTSLSAECEDPIFDSEELSFEVDSRNTEACYYEYTVQNSLDGAEGKSTSAESYVLITETAVSGTLPPIDETTTIGNDVVIDLNNQSFDVDGYVLNNTVIVLGDGNAVSDSSSNTITYTPSTIPGVTRLIYSMDSDSGQTTQTGYITVSVSASAPNNNYPVAESFQAPVDDSTGEPINIDIGDEITIDVAPYTSDADGDDLQLVEVYSIDATTALVVPDPFNFTNTEFTFQTSQPGNYDVSYTITDHRGGYDTSTVRVVVNSGQKWTDITLSEGVYDGTVYSAPWDEESATLARVDFQGVYTETIESIDYGIATFTWNSAREYCASQNKRLPTIAMLAQLYAEKSTIKDTDLWPIDEVYWTSEVSSLQESMYHAYDLTTGIESERLSSETAILTCVEHAILDVNWLTETDDIYQTVTDGNAQFHNFLITLVSTVGSSPIEGQLVQAYSQDSGVVLDDAIGITDSNGEVELNMYSVRSGDQTLTIQHKSSTHTQIVNFLEDAFISFRIEAPVDTLSVGSEVGILAYAFLASNPDEETVVKSALFDWTSSNPDVATVDSDGIVEGVAFSTEGVIITATEAGVTNPTPEQTSSVTVTVLEEAPYGDVGNFDVQPSIGSDTVATEITGGYWKVTTGDIDAATGNADVEAKVRSYSSLARNLKVKESVNLDVVPTSNGNDGVTSFSDELWFTCELDEFASLTFVAVDGPSYDAEEIDDTEVRMVFDCSN